MEIQCRCGAVRVELRGEPVAQFYCHCDDCQAAHGAAYIPVAAYPAEAAKVTRGRLLEWKLKVTTRATCSECGTRVFAERPGQGLRGVNGYLLPEGTFAPTAHLNCRFARIPIQDGLPHFATLPAMFGGSGELTSW